jgi:hypothetical protein
VKKLFVTAFKDLYVYRVPGSFLEKNSLIIIPHAAHQALGMCFSCGIPKVYSSTLQLLPYPFNVGFTVFFCLSDGSVNEEMGFLV